MQEKGSIICVSTHREVPVCERCYQTGFVDFERFVLRNVSVNKKSLHSQQMCPPTPDGFRGRVTAEPFQLISVLSNSCQYRGETAVRSSDLSNSLWGALMRHEQEGWRKEETWGEQGGGGGWRQTGGGCEDMGSE